MNQISDMAERYYRTYDSSLGRITMVSDGRTLEGLWIEGQHYYADSLKNPLVKKSLPVFDQTVAWLDCYFSGGKPDFMPPLSPTGTKFRKRVWEILLDIPYGQVRTYGDIGRQIAAEQGKEKMSAQAVGGAVGHNPISILIPCHRVIGSDGSLVGYGGGIDKKIALLKLEGFLF